MNHDVNRPLPNYVGNLSAHARRIAAYSRCSHAPIRTARLMDINFNKGMSFYDSYNTYNSNNIMLNQGSDSCSIDKYIQHY